MVWTYFSTSGFLRRWWGGDFKTEWEPHDSPRITLFILGKVTQNWNVNVHIANISTPPEMEVNDKDRDDHDITMVS